MSLESIKNQASNNKEKENGSLRDINSLHFHKGRSFWKNTHDAIIKGCILMHRTQETRLRLQRLSGLFITFINFSPSLMFFWCNFLNTILQSSCWCDTNPGESKCTWRGYFLPVLYLQDTFQDQIFTYYWVIIFHAYVTVEHHKLEK